LALPSSPPLFRIIRLYICAFIFLDPPSPPLGDPCCPMKKGCRHDTPYAGYLSLPFYLWRCFRRSSFYSFAFGSFVLICVSGTPTSQGSKWCYAPPKTTLRSFLLRFWDFCVGTGILFFLECFFFPIALWNFGEFQYHPRHLVFSHLLSFQILFSVRLIDSFSPPFPPCHAFFLFFMDPPHFKSFWSCRNTAD